MELLTMVSQMSIPSAPNIDDHDHRMNFSNSTIFKLFVNDLLSSNCRWHTVSVLKHILKSSKLSDVASFPEN